MNQFSAYYDPIWTAEDCVRRGTLIPVDLQEELMARGIDVEGLRRAVLAEEDQENIGFQIVEEFIRG